MNVNKSQKSQPHMTKRTIANGLQTIRGVLEARRLEGGVVHTFTLDVVLCGFLLLGSENALFT